MPNAPALRHATTHFKISRPRSRCGHMALTPPPAACSRSGLESLVRFGWIAAFGAMAALLATFTVLPVVLVRLPARWISPLRDPAGWRAALLGITRVPMLRPRLTLALTALLSLLAATGLGQLRVDASFEEIYGERNQVVRWARAAAEVRSAETLEVALTLPPGMASSAPEALDTLARLESLAQRPGLGRPLSVLAPMRELHRLFYGGELVLAGDARQPERFGSLQRMLRGEAPDLFALYVAPGALAQVQQKLCRTSCALDRPRRERHAAALPRASALVTGRSSW
jgi:hypothetical protein